MKDTKGLMGIGPCEQTTGPSRVEDITKSNEDPGMESPSWGCWIAVSRGREYHKLCNMDYPAIRDG